MGKPRSPEKHGSLKMTIKTQAALSTLLKETLTRKNVTTRAGKQRSLTFLVLRETFVKQLQQDRP